MLVGGLPERNVYTVLVDPDVMVSILVDVTTAVIVLALALAAPLLTVAVLRCDEHQLLASLCCWSFKSNRRAEHLSSGVTGAARATAKALAQVKIA